MIGQKIEVEMLLFRYEHCIVLHKGHYWMCCQVVVCPVTGCGWIPREGEGQVWGGAVLMLGRRAVSVHTNYISSVLVSLHLVNLVKDV